MDECKLVKAMSNAGNQFRYDEYLRILKEQQNIELVTKEEAVAGIACQTPDSMYWWLKVIETIEDCGYHICKVKGVD